MRGWLCAEGLFSAHKAQYAPHYHKKFWKQESKETFLSLCLSVSSAPTVPRAVGDGGNPAVPPEFRPSVEVCAAIPTHFHLGARGPTCWPRQLASGPGQAVRPPSPEWCPAAPLCGGSGKVRGCSPLTGGGYEEGHSPTGPESPRLGHGAESACGLEAHGTHNCISHVLPVRGRVWTRIS